MGPKDLVVRTSTLVSLPKIFFKVNELVEDPNSSASDIEKYICQDPGLAARLLKIANSPFYGFPSRISTVARAITVIGTKGLRDLILASSTIKNFNKLENALIKQEQFWQHSILTGVIARLLAKNADVLHTETFFVTGLLHDVGRLIMANKIPEMARETMNRSEISKTELHEEEQKVIGFTHAQVGAELLRIWKLPEEICDPVEFHHSPALSEVSAFNASLINIADALATIEEMKLSISELRNMADPSVWHLLDLGRDKIESIMEAASAQYKESAELFLTKAA